MPRPTTLLADSVAHTRRLFVLAVVPFVNALLQWKNVTAAAASANRYGVSFGLPLPIVDLWSFVSAPANGPASGVPAGSTPVPSTEPLVVVAAGIVAFLVVSGLLLAGYLGSIREGVARADGTFDFPANVRRYARPMVGFEFLVFGTMLVVVGLPAAVPPLVLLGFPAVFVLAYLFYPAPYLAVADDEPLVAALRRSYTLTAGGGGAAPLVFFVGYVAFSAALSLPLGAFALNTGPAGVLLAAAVAAAVGHALTVLAYLFVASLVDAGADDPPAPLRA